MNLCTIRRIAATGLVCRSSFPKATKAQHSRVSKDGPCLRPVSESVLSLVLAVPAETCAFAVLKNSLFNILRCFFAILQVGFFFFYVSFRNLWATFWIKPPQSYWSHMCYLCFLKLIIRDEKLVNIYEKCSTSLKFPISKQNLKRSWKSCPRPFLPWANQEEGLPQR